MPDRYDVVFCSYGCLVWLSNLSLWATRIAGILAPSGRVVLLDFHPFAMTLGWDWTERVPYFANGAPQSHESGVGDYVGMSGDALAPSGFEPGVASWANPHPGHELSWGLGEVATALTDTSLVLTRLTEHPFSTGAKLFDRMQVTPGRRMIPLDDVPNLPLMFGMVARRDQR